MHGQVHQQLLELTFVGMDLPRMLSQTHYHVHACTGHRLQQLGQFAQHRIRTDHFGMSRLPLAETRQLPRDLFGGKRGRADLLGGRARRRIIGELFQDTLRLRADNRQQAGVLLGHPRRQPGRRFHFLRLLLFPAAMSHVAEAQHCADRPASHAHRSRRAFHRYRPSRSCDQLCAAPQRHRRVAQHRERHGSLHRNSLWSSPLHQAAVRRRLRPLRRQRHNHFQRLSRGFLFGPSREPLRRRIQDAHSSFHIRHRNRIRHGPEHRREPRLAFGDLAFHGVLVHGDFNRGMQCRRCHRLHDVAERGGLFRAVHRCAVGVRGKEHHGDAVAFADDLRRLDAVHPPVEPDIHQYDLGFARQIHRFFARARNRRHAMPQRFQALRNVARDQALVLNQQHVVGPCGLTSRRCWRFPFPRLSFVRVHVFLLLQGT